MILGDDAPCSLRKTFARDKVFDKFLGAAIRHARKSKRMKALALAAACGTNVQRVSAWEIGTNPPGMCALRRISEAVGLSVSSIIGYAEGLQALDATMRADATRHKAVATFEDSDAALAD